MDEARERLEPCHIPSGPARRGIITTPPNRLRKNAGPGREKRTSAAKAVKRAAICGTAEAVPFVGLSLPRGSFGAVQIAQPKKSNLDKSEVQPVPIRQAQGRLYGTHFSNRRFSRRLFSS